MMTQMMQVPMMEPLSILVWYDLHLSIDVLILILMEYVMKKIVVQMMRQEVLIYDAVVVILIQKIFEKYAKVRQIVAEHLVQEQFNVMEAVMHQH